MTRSIALGVALLALPATATAQELLCNGVDDDSDGFTDPGCGIGCGIWTGPRAVGCSVITAGGQVHLVTGDTHVGPITDFRVRVPGERIELTRYWSSGLARNHAYVPWFVQPLGAGWSHTWMERVHPLGTIGSSDVVLARADGGIDRFSWNGSSWNPPRGHFRKLEHTGGRFVVTKEDGTRWEFEAVYAWGRLVQITDGGGNATQALHHPDGGTGCDNASFADHVCKVLYPSGRTLNFNYSMGPQAPKLDSVTLDRPAPDPPMELVRFEYEDKWANGDYRLIW